MNSKHGAWEADSHSCSWNSLTFTETKVSLLRSKKPTTGSYINSKYEWNFLCARCVCMHTGNILILLNLSHNAASYTSSQWCCPSACHTPYHFHTECSCVFGTLRPKSFFTGINRSEFFLARSYSILTMNPSRILLISSQGAMYRAWWSLPQASPTMNMTCLGVVGLVNVHCSVAILSESLLWWMDSSIKTLSHIWSSL